MKNRPLVPEALEPYLAMAYAPEPDLFIRTGGEKRISNFLLWQLAYTELYFTDMLWPDFDAAALACGDRIVSARASAASAARASRCRRRPRRRSPAERRRDQARRAFRRSPRASPPRRSCVVAVLAALFLLPPLGWGLVVLWRSLRSPRMNGRS